MAAGREFQGWVLASDAVDDRAPTGGRGQVQGQGLAGPHRELLGDRLHVAPRNRPGHGSGARRLRLVTTLVDARHYRKRDQAELYRRRWEAETYLRELKQILGMNVLRTKSTDMVRKEMLVLAVIYNLVRLIMLQAAAAQHVPVARLSFTDAWRHLAAHGQLQPAIALLANPCRPNRCEPRVVKRRPNPCTYMTKPRDQLRQQLKITAS
jgi:hypothetical protein